MASVGADPDLGKHTHSPRDWQEMVHLVNTSFDNIIDKVNKRRTKMLTLIKEFEEKETDLYKSIKKFDDMKNTLQEQMNDNLFVDFQQKTSEECEKKLSTLRIEANKYTDSMFVFDEKEIDRALSVLGGVELRPKHYLEKGVPKLAFCNLPDNSMHKPIQTSCDEELDLVAVTDVYSRQVFLYSMKGGFIQSFGRNNLKFPYAVKIISETELFVSDFTHQIIYKVKFYRNQANKAKITEFLTGVAAITSMDYDKESKLLYATSSINHCILMITSEGELQSKILNFFIFFPQALCLTKDEIYVLDRQNPALHIFSKSSHEILRSIIPSGIGLNHEVSSDFTLDQDGNILLVEMFGRCSVHIYSPSGQLLHSFSKKGTGLGELIYPTSISVTQNKDILVLSRNPDYPVQIF